MEQGFETPCFLVNLLEYENENLTENERFFRSKETLDIQVIFFPEETTTKRTEKRQIYSILPELVASISRVNLYNKNVRANSSKSVIVDNTAQVLVSFDFNTISLFKGQYMERLEKVGGTIGN